MTGTEKHFRVCNLCEAMCGLQVEHKDGEVVRIISDKLDPFSKGSICPKGPALKDLHEDPDKLRHPVKRTSKGWVEISWEAAFDEIEANLKGVRKRYGNDAVGLYLGNPIVHNLGMMSVLGHFRKALKTRNVFSATSMDQLPHHFAAHFMFGHSFRIPVPDVDRTQFIIIMGANPVASNGSIMSSAGIRQRLTNITRGGGKIVLIDPRRTESSKAATEHHFIRPGTDAYLLAAMLHIIFRDGLANPGRLSAHIRDMQALEAAIKPFTPHFAEQLTGVSVGVIEELTRSFCSHERAVLYGRMGLSTQPHGGLCQWLINVINIVTGNFDRAGGMMFPNPAVDIVGRKQGKAAHGRWRSRVRKLPEFDGELPVSALSEEMNTAGEGQIRGLVTICGNPVLSAPHGGSLEKPLEQIDFMVSIDNYINETTRHAHIILPTPSGLEIPHYDLIFNAFSVRNNAKLSQPLFPPEDGRWSDWQILKELTRRLSAKRPGWLFELTTPMRLVRLGLLFGPYGKFSHPGRLFSGLSLKKVEGSVHGVDLGPLKPGVPDMLRTPDRKINVAHELFVRRLGELADNPPSGRDFDAGSFALIGRRNLRTNNSWMHNVEKLVSARNLCTAMINPADADRLGIADGEPVKVSSSRGQIEITAEVTDTIMEGVVSIPHGFGHGRPGTRLSVANAHAGASVNDITDPDSIDPLTGNAAFSGQRVEISLVPSPAAEGAA